MSFLPRHPWARAAPLPAEIAFLLDAGVPAGRLARAGRLAEAAGTDAATALLNHGLVAEEAYYRALARRLGLPFLDAPDLGPGARYPDSLVLGQAPLAAPAGPARGPACGPAHVLAHVLAPRGPAVAEWLAGGRDPGGPRGGGLALTTPTRLRAAVFAALPEAIAERAAGELEASAPGWAFGRGQANPWLLFLGLVLTVGACLFQALPAGLGLAAALAGQAVFLGMTTFRLAALWEPAPVAGPARAAAGAPPLPDRRLPVYTVLVALHREAPVVPRLVRALAALDYPAAKLDLKFVIEAGDRETAAALAAERLPAAAEVIAVPPGLPRTKPRALNAALPLARGRCLVVFDAEDVPDPGQLRRAAEAFARLPPTTACLQGRLVIDNAGDSLLARLFALEYAGLFDVLNPALARWALPLPLGGTSTHFRTQALRAVHAYDPHNVTEDADLGIRLALAGYRVADLPGATIEEAPARFRPWLHQRVRWLKGFMQTSLTHGRSPIATARGLGPLETFAALTLVPGTVASALAYPVCMGVLAWQLACAPPVPASTFLANLPLGLAIVLFLAGLAAAVLPPLVGCLRRDWRDLRPYVLLMPGYYALVSLAAWLALIELIRKPERWNKTEHGLARTSRSGRLGTGRG